MPTLTYIMKLFTYVLCFWSVVSETTQVLSHSHTCDSLTPHMLRLERTVAVLETEVQSLKSKERMTTSEIKKHQALLFNITQSIAKLQTDVAYEVSLLSDLSSVHDNTPLKFSNVLYNRGGGFKKSTGIFSAPVSGTYMFWAHIMVNDEEQIAAAIYKEGREIGRSYTLKNMRYGIAAFSTVTNLNKGDQVWVAKWSGSSMIRGLHYSSYGGALLHPN